MKTPIGFFFREIHKIILNLYNEGVILCLCSKNNEQDVLDFVDQNSELNLNSDNFLIKKINWKNKHDNIFEISKKLNTNNISLSIPKFIIKTFAKIGDVFKLRFNSESFCKLTNNLIQQ